MGEVLNGVYRLTPGEETELVLAAATKTCVYSGYSTGDVAGISNLAYFGIFQ